MKCYEIKNKCQPIWNYYPKGSSIIIMYGIIITIKDRIVDRWMDGCNVTHFKWKVSIQVEFYFITHGWNFVTCVHCPCGGCNEKPLTNESYHMEDEIIYERKWNFVINNFFLMKLTTWMLKGITWMKVNDMDEINPIINLFHYLI
jgi:hypothetical protein